MTAAPQRAFIRRLQSELVNMFTEPFQGISVNRATIENDNLSIWVVDMNGVDGTLYDGETFQLEFRFDQEYPINAPKVRFVGDHIPLNPHVFSNGDICLSILTKDWSPMQNVATVCLSIISMLSSCKEKKLPSDNDYYLQMKKTNPNAYQWVYYNANA